MKSFSMITFIVLYCSLAILAGKIGLPNVGFWSNGPSNGVHWALNASSGGAYIMYASTTLEVPKPVNHSTAVSGALGFFPALSDNRGDLMQTVVATWAQGDR